MPFSSSQQLKLDAAQKKLDAAKAAYQSNVDAYNNSASLLAPCYKDAVPDVNAASTWFNAFSKGPCMSKGSCKVSDCKNTIDYLNSVIPPLKASYGQLNDAQQNYDKVFKEVTAEAAADPQLQLEQAAIEANASANKLKWIFWIAVVVVVAIASFVYFKWVRKKI